MSDRWLYFRDEVWPWIRSVLIFSTGLIGFLHEVLTVGVERPTLLLVLAAMMGVPIAFKADEKRRRGKDGDR